MTGIPVGDTSGRSWAQPRRSHPWVDWELLPVLGCEVPVIGVCHRDFTPSALLKGKKEKKKKIYILTVTHHLPFWNLWGCCNLHKAVQKSKTILNNRGGKKV